LLKDVGFTTRTASIPDESNRIDVERENRSAAIGGNFRIKNMGLSENLL
jgi:hypothetical protein